MFTSIVSIAVASGKDSQVPDDAGLAMDKILEINDASEGTMLAWKQRGNDVRLKSAYIAPNGVIVSFDISKNHHFAQIGQTSIESSRSGGNLHVSVKAGDHISTQDFTADQATASGQQVQELMRKAPSLTNEESQAYQALLAFLKKHQSEIGGASSSADPTMWRCVFNLAAFYLITGGAIATCVESVGLLCAAGAAAAYQSLDTAKAVCDDPTIA